MEQLALAGAVVTIGYNGKTEIERGLVRPEDMPKKAAAGKTASAEGAEDSQASSLSAALVESLTAHKSAALSVALQERPDIALAAVVHALASGIFSGHRDTSLQLKAEKQSLNLVEGSKAFAQLEDAHAAWGRKLPASTEELWQWCLDQKQQTLLELLAFCAATTINAVQGKSDRLENPRLVHADRLALAVSLDMKDWFTPDAENYFSRVSKPQILGDLQEANGQPPAPAWEKLKKADLAKEAERQIVGKAWLPALLRPAA
ncbi:MAG: hypothetical protein PSY14_12940 [bacterium]|nr:hypothetical protein [bacterium]